ncbi:MAG TPA: thioesterase [Prolixibacteraceae bacterium]|nr:thioesterase [Prolixibacteraceae bacterium]
MGAFHIKPGSPGKFSEDFVVRSYHTDLHRQLTIPKLCSFFQDIAGNHTVACGVGWEVMQEQNVFWVLSRLKIDVTELPVWRQKIRVSTWSMGSDGLFAFRNFRVEDAFGNTMVKAVSMWLMVNTETRRLVRPDDYMRDFPLCTEKLFDTEPEKLPMPNNPCFSEAAAVSFTETDMNRHMNNVCYIERILNTCDFDFLLGHSISGFQINFLKEAVPGDRLKTGTVQTDPLRYMNNIVRESDGVEMVRTEIMWKTM